MKHRTSAYWPTRIMLAVGFIATVIAVVLPLLLLTQPLPGPLHDAPPPILGLPTDLVFALVSPVPALVGLVCMLRIFRGPRDEPRAWRYRDR